MTEEKYSYDVLPYEGSSYKPSHPNCLATVATLFGLQPPALDRCRVLELGCASGENLIPMAYSLPDSVFVGIDLSSKQVSSGESNIRTLGLSNIELKVMNFLDVDKDFGQFDYIVVHGIYSWVPPEVQEKILNICAENLSAEGIAYVSYNAYPGWHMRGIVREMMLFITQSLADPLAKAQRAREYIEFWAQAIPPSKSDYGNFIKREAKSIRQDTDSYLCHDYLEVENSPIYFYQFAEKLKAHGLQFLAESDVDCRLAADLPRKHREILQKMSADVIELEQHVDFLTSRMFRRTLICHAHHKPDRKNVLERMSSLKVASAMQPEERDPDFFSETKVRYRGPSGARVWVNDPVIKQALLHLGTFWPRPIPFDTLWDKVASQAKLPPVSESEDTAAIRRRFAQALLVFYIENSLELFATDVRQYAEELSERPIASSLARYQVEVGSERVTNQHHHPVAINELERQTLKLLDGSRDREMLKRDLCEVAMNGELEIRDGYVSVRDPERIRQILDGLLEQCLKKLCHYVLLIG